MRLFTLLLFAGMLQTSARGLAQQVSLSGKNMTLKKVFTAIEKQTGYVFFCNAELLKEAKPVNIDLRGTPLALALQVIMKDQPLDFSTEGKTIVISKKAPPLYELPALAPPRITIYGHVRNSKGEPIPGASVLISTGGLERTIITDEKGDFSFVHIPEGKYIIAVSSLGFARSKQALDLTEAYNPPLNIVLQDAVTGLDETVVIAYGTTTRNANVGAIATVKGKDLVKVPGTNVTQMLAGRMPGLIAMNNNPNGNGAPGADDATLLIRGLSTVGDNSPLIVIDGIPRNSISRIDPNDIETISILKDAAAIAAYGARAANGVILLTTKRGTGDKTTITYTMNMGVQRPVQLPSLENGYQTALSWNEAWQNEGTFAPSLGGAKGFSDSALNLIKTGANPDRFANTNWYRTLLDHSPLQQQHNLSVNGGGAKTRYFISAGYLDQDGFFPTANFKRYNLRANFDANIARDLDFALNLSYRIEDQQRPANAPLGAVLQTSPLQPVKYSNGTYPYITAVVGNPYLMGIGSAGTVQNTNNVLENSMSLQYHIPFVPGLSVKGLLGFDKGFIFNKNYQLPYTAYVLNDDNSFGTRTSRSAIGLNESYMQGQSLTEEASVMYDRHFHKHGVKGLLLYTQTQNKADTLGAARSSFVSAALPQLSVGSLVGSSNNGTAGQNARQGVVGRFDYDYDGKYLFDFSFRYDGSDVFPPGHRFGFFPALAAGWRISEEPFFKDHVHNVDNLKIRGSWGKAGNDRVGQFQYLNTYTIAAAGGYPFGGTSATAGQIITPGVIPNVNFTWEKATISDVGLDLSLWEGKLTFEGEYFYKRTSDILINRSFEIPVTVGGSLPADNAGVVDNHGFEAAIGHQGKITKDLTYFAKLNFTYNRSRVVSYPEAANIPAALRKQGKPVSPDASTGYIADGYYQSDDEVAKGPTPLYANTKAGDLKYVDVNKDNKITTADQVIINRGATPGVIYGLNAGLSFKGLDFNVFLQGAADAHTMLPAADYIAFNNGIMSLLSYEANHWTPNNPNAAFPRLTVTSLNNRANSTFWIKNTAYMRVKNAELGYTFNPAFLKKSHLGALRVYINGSNLFTFSKVKHIMDPETGVSASNYPLVKVFNGGFSVQF